MLQNKNSSQSVNSARRENPRPLERGIGLTWQMVVFIFCRLNDFI
jgi:hypothetical protein